jgi:hypothetical protein
MQSGQEQGGIFSGIGRWMRDGILNLFAPFISDIATHLAKRKVLARLEAEREQLVLSRRASTDAESDSDSDTESKDSESESEWEEIEEEPPTDAEIFERVFALCKAVLDGSADENSESVITTGREALHEMMSRNPSVLGFVSIQCRSDIGFRSAQAASDPELIAQLRSRSQLLADIMRPYEIAMCWPFEMTLLAWILVTIPREHIPEITMENES